MQRAWDMEEGRGVKVRSSEVSGLPLTNAAYPWFVDWPSPTDSHLIRAMGKFAPAHERLREFNTFILDAHVSAWPTGVNRRRTSPLVVETTMVSKGKLFQRVCKLRFADVSVGVTFVDRRPPASLEASPDVP